MRVAKMMLTEYASNIHLKKIREKGREEGRLKTVLNTLRRHIRRQLPISDDVLADIAEDNEMTVDKVRTIARDNGISLS